jgi:hypothetical protein
LLHRFLRDSFVAPRPVFFGSGDVKAGGQRVEL